MFEQGNSLVWNASPSLATDDIEGATVTYKRGLGEHCNRQKRVEFEVFLDELEDPDQF